jgi:hypothetical protein
MACPGRLPFGRFGRLCRRDRCPYPASDGYGASPRAAPAIIRRMGDWRLGLRAGSARSCRAAGRNIGGGGTLTGQRRARRPSLGGDGPDHADQPVASKFAPTNCAYITANDSTPSEGLTVTAQTFSPDGKRVRPAGLQAVPGVSLQSRMPTPLLHDLCYSRADERGGLGDRTDRGGRCGCGHPAVSLTGRGFLPGGPGLRFASEPSFLCGVPRRSGHRAERDARLPIQVREQGLARPPSFEPADETLPIIT